MTQSTKAPTAKPVEAARTAATKPTKEAVKREAVQYRYQLAQYLVERRPDGWYFAKTWSMVAGESRCGSAPMTCRKTCVSP